MYAILSKYQIAAAELHAILPLTEHPRGTSTLSVHVLHARNAKGKISVTLFNGAEGFPVTLRKQPCGKRSTSSLGVSTGSRESINQ